MQFFRAFSNLRLNHESGKISLPSNLFEVVHETAMSREEKVIKGFIKPPIEYVEEGRRKEEGRRREGGGGGKEARKEGEGGKEGRKEERKIHPFKCFYSTRYNQGLPCTA